MTSTKVFGCGTTWSAERTRMAGRPGDQLLGEAVVIPVVADDRTFPDRGLAQVVGREFVSDAPDGLRPITFQLAWE